MPIYEYICETCGRESELLVSRSDALPRCPECGGERMLKKFSTFAAHSESPASDAPPCGRCGGTPGSCMFGGN